MPPLFVVIFTILIGWPLVKLAATMAGRGKWRTQRRLKAALDSDPRYGDLERRIVAEKFEDGRGSLGQLALPFVAFFGGLTAAFALSVQGADQGVTSAKVTADLNETLVRLQYPGATQVTVDLLGDEKFNDLSDRAFELAMLRYPLATAATAVAITPALALMIGVKGLRLSLNGVARRIIESSQQTVRTFSTLLSRAALAP